jgi:hypothetical protein
MSFSVISSVLLTIVAPQALATLRLSVFLSRRMTVMPCFIRKCWAKSETPFSVMT